MIENLMKKRVYQSNKIQKDLVFDQSSYNAFWLFAVVPISDVIRVRTGNFLTFIPSWTNNASFPPFCHHSKNPHM